jgi:hypothetical protein
VGAPKLGGSALATIRAGGLVRGSQHVGEGPRQHLVDQWARQSAEWATSRYIAVVPSASGSSVRVDSACLNGTDALGRFCVSILRPSSQMVTISSMLPIASVQRGGERPHRWSGRLWLSLPGGHSNG